MDGRADEAVRMTTARDPTPANAARLVALRLATPIAASVVVIAVSATTDARILPIIRTVAIGFIVVALLFAFVPKRLDVRTHGCVSASIVAVVVMGLTRAELPYEITCALFAVVAIATLRMPLVLARIEAARRMTPRVSVAGGAAGAASEAMPRGPTPAVRAWNAMSILAVVAGAVIASLLLALPPLSAVAERQVQRLGGNMMHADDQIGFTTTLRIGALRRPLQSDRVVMRMKGEDSPYLRGVVLDRYDGRIWSGAPGKKSVPAPANAPEDLSTTHIEMSRSALSARTPEPRWFLPADACDIHTASGRMSVDPFGMAHPDPINDTREISFRHTSTSACTTLLPASVPPSKQDLRIGDKVNAQLGPIAMEWTKETKGDRAALDAIVLHLKAYGYTLEGSPDGGTSRTDPVVEFLYQTKRGHCELFASAMALLAREIGIPSRIVVGYHTDEVNPITGFTVVRDRNAHSWVEAWVDGHWEAYDPTPASELMSSTRPSRWDHFTEMLSFGWDRTINFFVGFGLKGAGITSAIVAVVLIALRRFMQRGAKKTGTVTLETSPPLPAFETLATALARAGWPRASSEPLDVFARRVVTAGEPWSADVAEALARYAELRYGGIGEEKVIAERLDELARRVPASA